ncbi:hypothetical protein BASA81_008527 [Batrachochytrium salamandrivorans]|nr:hypothetical protein BASA81_008527 [Batrachochytrium salamandrivorans]
MHRPRRFQPDAHRDGGGEDSFATRPENLKDGQAVDSQAFSEAYPTYELTTDASSPALSDEEAEKIAAKVASSQPEKEELQPLSSEQTKQVDRFVDQREYDAAPYIAVPFARVMRQPLWWALKPYESYGRLHPLKQHVPRLNPDIQLTPEMFHEQFRRHGQPVIISYKSLQHLGYRTRPWTFDELVKLFPFDESSRESTVIKAYKANSIRKDEEEIDLGPGLASILRDEKLAKQGTLRNYPRNLHIKKEALRRMEVDIPPLIPGGPSTWQLPTLWLGTTTADTPFHHDCCDNFVVMLAGVKRFTLAPPTDWRTLSPVCTGPNKSLCWAKVSDPAKSESEMTKRNQEIMKSVHKITVELQPGEIMYMPAGWFHHIKNLGPTVMVNYWTTSSQQIGLRTKVQPAERNLRIRKTSRKGNRIKNVDGVFYYNVLEPLEEILDAVSIFDTSEVDEEDDEESL